MRRILRKIAENKVSLLTFPSQRPAPVLQTSCEINDPRGSIHVPCDNSIASSHFICPQQPNL